MHCIWCVAISKLIFLSVLSFPQAKCACLPVRQVGNPSENKERFPTSRNDKDQASHNIFGLPTEMSDVPNNL